jgi:hypothetical protein
MTRMFGLVPPAAVPFAAVVSSAWANRVSAEAEDGADVVVTGSTAGVVFWLASIFPLAPPDAAGRVEQAMMPPIIARATQAAGRLLSFGMTSSSFESGGVRKARQEVRQL